MKVPPKTTLFLICTILVTHAKVIATQSNDAPSLQLIEFGKTLQISGAMPALNSLLSPNPFYPDGLDYAKQLLFHYEKLTDTVGTITHLSLIHI